MSISTGRKNIVANFAPDNVGTGEGDPKRAAQAASATAHQMSKDAHEFGWGKSENFEKINNGDSENVRNGAVGHQNAANHHERAMNHYTYIQERPYASEAHEGAMKAHLMAADLQRKAGNPGTPNRKWTKGGWVNG